GEIPGDRKRRIAQEARLAAGSERLSGLPELGIALDGETLQSAQRIGAAFGRNGLLDQIAGTVLGERGRHLACGQQQGGNRQGVFHGRSSVVLLSKSTFYPYGLSSRRMVFRVPDAVQREAHKGRPGPFTCPGL